MIAGIRKSVHFIIISSVLFLGYVSTNYVNAALIVPNTTNSPDSMDKMKVPHLGVNMRGYYTSMPQSRIVRNVFPTDYYDSSFKILSKVGVVDHVRFRFYWESYVKNPVQFIKEIEQVADTADKYGIKVLYDNHQFHTSSWLNIDRGTGFPTFLFTNTTLYQQDAGGSPKSVAAKTWWINWWNNAIRINGTDGWRLQSDFLKKVVSALDKHTSTLGYEILSEPQVNNVNQWSKIGKYNTFMTNELRKVTSKTIVYSMNIPIDLKSPINVNPANLAKMTPMNKENVIFKFSLYGIPSGGYQAQKLDLFLNTSRISGVPLYVGEWNNVKRLATTDQEGKKIFEISANESDISQTDANMIVQKFRQIGIWGMAYWSWSFVPEKIPNFNLIGVEFDNATGQRKIQTTSYFDIMKNAYESLYGNPAERVFPTGSKQ
ncbi:MAG TPA: hypothetical protein VF884_14320 [Nitrososphaeraceae archaeon]